MFSYFLWKLKTSNIIIYVNSQVSCLKTEIEHDKELSNVLFLWIRKVERYFFLGSPYSWKGFLTLQSALDLSFLQKEAELNKKYLPDIVLESQEFPYPPYRTDLGFTNLLSEFLSLITLFSFSFVCPAVLQRVVEEKYTGVKV